MTLRAQNQRANVAFVASGLHCETGHPCVPEWLVVNSLEACSKSGWKQDQGHNAVKLRHVFLW